MSARSLWTGLCLAALLAACERAPDASVRHTDVPAWQGSTGAAPFSVGSWKRGDKAAWEEQLRNRARGQNEYARTS